MTTGVDSLLAWYGFGKSEEVFVDIELTTVHFPRASFLNLAVFVLTPGIEHDLGAVVEQPLELVARLLTFAPDLNALQYAALDESALGNPVVRLPFDAPPGLYYIAVTDHETATHLPPSALDLVTSSSVLDFAGGLMCSSFVQNFTIELSVETLGGDAPLTHATAISRSPPHHRASKTSTASSAGPCPDCPHSTHLSAGLTGFLAVFRHGARVGGDSRAILYP